MLEHALGEIGQHDRREHLQQHAGAIAAEAGGLAQRLFRAWLLAAEDVAQDLAAIALRRTATEHRAEDAADIKSGVVLLQGAKQRLGALRLAGVAAERAKQQGQGSADRAGHLRRANAELLRHLLQRRAFELRIDIVSQCVAHCGCSMGETCREQHKLRGSSLVFAIGDKPPSSPVIPAETGFRARVGSHAIMALAGVCNPCFSLPCRQEGYAGG